MKKTIMIFFTIVLLASSLYIINNPSQSRAFIKPETELLYDRIMKQDILCLMLAYPEHITGIEKTDDKVYLILKSGQKLLYDDRKAKNMEQKMAYPDLQDMLEQLYPLTSTGKLMDKGYDPGRVRVYGLLKEVYGSSQQQIEKQLENVTTRGGSFRFSNSNSAGDALKAAMEELVPLAQSSSKVAAAAFPSSGTYNYRLIAGTNRLSSHAFGIAIDLARDSRDYWQWGSREEGQKRIEAYPSELVELFEKHNFVWGGKWGHFDILHYEYRPEIIMKARYFSGEPQTGAPEEAAAKELIRKIDEALK